jgi:sulfur-oxidizing protein SoxZ
VAADPNIHENNMAEKPRLKVPSEARKGDIVVIRTLFSHPMETGFRKGEDGKVIARKIVNSFACDFNGTRVFGMDLEPAIAANPYIQFNAKVEDSGTFTFTWTDDDGTVTTANASITVT